VYGDVGEAREDENPAIRGRDVEVIPGRTNSRGLYMIVYDKASSGKRESRVAITHISE
jgi:hypothetical protein